MGLPIKRFIAANNRNDIFLQYLQTGVYTPKPSVATIANAMDVGDPSNFARILDLYKNSHEAICADISGSSYTDEEIADTLKKCYQQNDYLLDPHGACAYRALTEQIKENEIGVFLETAHPAKFLETVQNIIKQEVVIPEKLQEFMKGKKEVEPMSKEFSAFKAFLMVDGIQNNNNKKTIVLKSYDNPTIANLEHGILQDAGVECFLSDESVVNLYPMFSSPFGGVKLHVFEEDKEKALEILGTTNS